MNEDLQNLVNYLRHPLRYDEPTVEQADKWANMIEELVK